MLSEKIKDYAHGLWLETGSTLGTFANKIEDKLQSLRGDEKTLMELSYASLPASDIASVEFEVFLAYTKHALFLRKNSPFCKDISEDIFLHNVFYPRINSEDIVDCRGFFYEKLKKLTENKCGADAALAVNLWCGENMTYEMTDSRTVNPLTAYNCTLGRCGEESTFAVTALRSVGIPARQVYVPWWSHCDDNHAWVEVYTDGNWHYLGACEPDLKLDCGWFSGASGRAMLVCSKNFFEYVGEGLKEEKLIQKKGISLAYNQIFRYAKTVKTTVKLKDEKGRAIKDGWIRFYLENMAELAEIAALETDSEGKVTIETGLGSVLIEAEHKGHYAWLRYNAERNNELCLCPEQEGPAIGEYKWTFEAPGPGPCERHILSNALRLERAEMLRLAAEKRLSRLNTYRKPEYESCGRNMQHILEIAAGHSAEIWNFYKKYGIEAEKILLSLKEKDWRDADTGVLASHIERSRRYSNDENFTDYIQCPRIGGEPISDWRRDVEKYLSREEKDKFSKDPGKLWLWINENFREGNLRLHPVLWQQPAAVFKLKAADQRGRRLLFVAILRTLGIAARLNPVDKRAEFWKDGGFFSPEAGKPGEKSAVLRLNVESSMMFRRDYGLSRWNNGWEAMDLSEAHPEKLVLPFGRYCLHTVNRLPNGNQLITHSVFDFSSALELNVEKIYAKAEQMLAAYKIRLPVENRGPELQLYLEPGTEPTEHCLNELMEAKEQLWRLKIKGLNLRLIVPDKKAMENPTVNKLLKLIQGIDTEVYNFQDPVLESLARGLYLEPGLWPLITLTDGKISYYASAGYSVGSVGLALKLSEFIIKKDTP